MGGMNEQELLEWKLFNKLTGGTSDGNESDGNENVSILWRAGI